MPTTSPSRLPWSPLRKPPRWIRLSLEPLTELLLLLLLIPPNLTHPSLVVYAQNSLSCENHKGAALDDKQHANHLTSLTVNAFRSKGSWGRPIDLLYVIRTRWRRGQGAPNKEWICMWRKRRICFKLYVYFSCLHPSRRFPIFVVMQSICHFFAFVVLYVCMYVLHTSYKCFVCTWKTALKYQLSGLSCLKGHLRADQGDVNRYKYIHMYSSIHVLVCNVHTYIPVQSRVTAYILLWISRFDEIEEKKTNFLLLVYNPPNSSQKNDN